MNVFAQDVSKIRIWKLFTKKVKVSNIFSFLAFKGKKALASEKSVHPIDLGSFLNKIMKKLFSENGMYPECT
jgi:hypothetical protein